MLALQAYENRVCPLCGMDTAICHDEERFEGAWARGEVELCFATHMRNKALEEYRASGSQDPAAAGAVSTRLIPRTPAARTA